MITKPTLSRSERWAYGLFWSWNLIFVSFMTLGFAPRMLPDLLKATAEGLIPMNFFINGLILSLVPLPAILLGLTVLRRAPGRLFALGYVIEGPLMLLLAVRLFLIRQANPAVTFILVTALLGMSAFLWYLLQPEIKEKRPWSGWIRLAGLTLILLLSLYTSLWILFYAIPLLAEFLKWFWHTLTHLGAFLKSFWQGILDLFKYQIAWVPFYLLGFVLLLYTATLVVLTPLAVPLLTIRTWWRILKDQIRRHGRVLPLILVSITVFITAVLFSVTNHQPQHQAFSLLENPPSSLEQAKALREREGQLRKGLLNAYLAPFRYISAMGEVRHIREIYQSVFKIHPQNALNIQRLYENIARPLLYDPVYPAQGLHQDDNVALVEEPQIAAQLYQRFFDTTIVEGERAAIVKAVRSTWSATQAEAAWQAVDEREVYLLRQEVSIQEHGDWADVELYEVYQNRTSQRQEVVYYFSLPESAVLTGVWLGESADRSRRFSYQVAPRGAAQTVYREQTRRQLDPALLEQIGPRQYRLRAFPVQPIATRYDEVTQRLITSDAPPLHMWMTYRTMSNQGTWPMPRLAVVRNVYWDYQTIRLINGKEAVVDELIWLPESVSAFEPTLPVAHRVDLPGGETVLAIPEAQISRPDLPANLRLAVVLDRSYSMATHASQVAMALEQLQKMAEAGALIDIYQTASLYRGESPTRVSISNLIAEKIEFIGGQNPAELLVQFEELRDGRIYDAVLVVTDGTGYELGPSPVEVPVPSAPIWMIHLDSNLPLGYDDQTLEAIQSSGGGIASNINEALYRLMMARSETTNDVVQDLVDGYLWKSLPTQLAKTQAENFQIHSAEGGFAALAARRYILAEIQRQRGKLQHLETLDRLHELAIQYSIVTPYSSMIVLVNAQQQQMLNREEIKSDRFEREVEAVGETTPPSPPPLTGVPEPEEWLLISVVAILLAWHAISQKRRSLHKI